MTQTWSESEDLRFNLLIKREFEGDHVAGLEVDEINLQTEHERNSEQCIAQWYVYQESIHDEINKRYEYNFQSVES